jgi:hypothetical protein
MQHWKQRLILSSQQPHSMNRMLQTVQLLKPYASRMVGQWNSNLLGVIISRTALLSTTSCSQTQTLVKVRKLPPSKHLEHQPGSGSSSSRKRQR